MSEKSKAYLNITKYNRLYRPFSFVLDYMGLFPLFLTLWAFSLCSLLYGPFSFVLDCMGLFPLFSIIWAFFLSSRLYGPFSFVLDYMGLFPLFSTSNIFSINEMTLILKIISHHEVKHVMVLSISRLTYDLKVFKGLDLHYH